MRNPKDSVWSHLRSYRNSKSDHAYALNRRGMGNLSNCSYWEFYEKVTFVVRKTENIFSSSTLNQHLGLCFWEFHKYQTRIEQCLKKCVHAYFRFISRF